MEYGYTLEELGTPLKASEKLIVEIQTTAFIKNVNAQLAKGCNIDAYHVYSNPARFAKNPEVILKNIECYKSQGATIRDMESGTLFMISQLRGVDAATV